MKLSPNLQDQQQLAAFAVLLGCQQQVKSLVHRMKRVVAFLADEPPFSQKLVGIALAIDSVSTGSL